MKKLFLVCLAALALALPAFANGGSDSDTVVLKVMGYGDNSNQEGVTWKRQVQTFMELHPNVEIQSELLYDPAYHDAVPARIAGNEIPHIAYMGADARWGSAWIDADLFVDHSEWFSGGDFDLDLIPDMGPGGEFFYIPLGTSNITTVLYMNTPLVESLGFSAPETYEDIVAMVPAAQAAGLEVITINGADGWAWGSCLMSSLIARISGMPDFVSRALDGEVAFTDDAFVQSLEMIQQMVDDGVISSSSVLVDYGANLSTFSNGNALFMVQGQWAAGQVENTEIRDSMALLAWPEFPGEQSSMAGSVAAAWQVGYGLNKTALEDPAVLETAIEFLRFINSPEESTARLRTGNIVAPVNAGYVVPDDMPNEIKAKVALAQSAPNVQVIDSVLTGPPNDALNAGIQAIVSGSATPEEVAADIQSLLN